MTPRECAYATASHASIRWGRSSRRCRSDSQRANRAFSVSPRISSWAQKRVPSARRASSYTATIPGWLSWAVSLASRRKRFQAVLSLGLEWGDSAGARSSFNATSRPTNSSTARRTTDCPPRPNSPRRVYCPSLSAGTVLSSSAVAARSGLVELTAVPNVRETAATPPSDARTSAALPCRAARASFASASSSSRRADVSAPVSWRCVKSERGSLPIRRAAAASITCFGVTKPACVASTPTIRSRSCMRFLLSHVTVLGVSPIGRPRHQQHASVVRGLDPHLLKSCVLCFGFEKDGNVRISVLPERKKVVLGAAALCGIARLRLSCAARLSCTLLHGRLQERSRFVIGADERLRLAAARSGPPYPPTVWRKASVTRREKSILPVNLHELPRSVFIHLSGALGDVDPQLDAAVCRAAVGGRVVGDGIGRARSFDEHLPLADAAACQNVPHRLGPA